MLLFYSMNWFKKKKKGISEKSANFARLIKYFCKESGIPLQTQLNITKRIAADYIDNENKTLSDFLIMNPILAKEYLKKSGLNNLDSSIFWSILQHNKNDFLDL